MCMAVTKMAAFPAGLCNSSVARIMRATELDPEVMPVHRYRQARRAYCLYRSLHAGGDNVQRVKAMLGMRRGLWKACLAEVLCDCGKAFLMLALLKIRMLMCSGTSTLSI